MKVGVGVLTYDHLRTGRQEDFEETWRTIHETGYEAEIKLLTNGSSDGTEKVVKKLGGIVDNHDDRVFYGYTRLIEELRHNDLIVISADDLRYQPNWLERLVSFVQEAPDDIVLFSCMMEPSWPWNRPSETVEHGGEKALIRASLPGASWAFHSEQWFDWIGPYPQIMPGEDLAICERIRHHGKRMAALDLTEHIGEERSAWGNKSFEHAQPLNKEAWGLV